MVGVLTLLKQRYQVLDGQAGDASDRVVKAMDRQHGRIVALKIYLAGGDAQREQLLASTRTLLALPPHPSLPSVREDFFDGDNYIVAMDWVDGTDLATLLRDQGRAGLAPTRVMAYLAQAAEALTHLHTQSSPVIHGDVRPANLILARGGKVKLVGLSSASGRPRSPPGRSGYQAPEVAGGAPPSRASDVYGLAATAFALLTGAPPAGGARTVSGVTFTQSEQLEEALRLALAIDPTHRPATPGELVERLRGDSSAGLPSGVVTFCMSDIEGSTALWDAHPALMADALVRHDELIIDAVEGHGGRVVQTMGEGDSTVSVFDSAPRAVRAAIAANRALTDEKWPSGISIAVRWGLHTGEVERRGEEYRGPTIILAARLRAQADGGHVFLSEVSADLVSAHLPAGYELVDLGPHRLKGLDAPHRIAALKGPDVNAPLPVGECPYRGLPAFESDDRLFFFGREAVVNEILARIVPGGLLAVVGASGSGKSSVLRAGVLAAVQSGEVANLVDASLLTPGSEPVLEVPDDVDRLVIVDQFEELFTVCGDEDRRAGFIDELLRLRCAVVIGLRADFYGRLSGHNELMRAVADNQIPLGAMTPSELERAISAPARLAGLTLEPGLSELVLRDIAAQPGALPLMSHALRATWERRDGRRLTVGGYRESGGVSSALARTADAVVDALPDSERQLVRSLFLRMTELGEGVQDTRRRAPLEELMTESATAETVYALVTRLADARLVTVDERSVEVAHEALIREWPRLRRWLEEDRVGIRMHRQLGHAAREWSSGGREVSDLYRGARLAGAVELAQTGRAELNSAERAFLDASLAEADRERDAHMRSNRRLRTLLAAAVLLLIMAVVAGILALGQRNQARHAQSLATARARTSDAERIGAQAVIEPRLDVAMLLAREAVRLDPSPQTESALLATLVRDPAVIGTIALPNGAVGEPAFSPDGRTLAVGESSGKVQFFDARTRTLQARFLSLFAGRQPPLYSRDGTLIAYPGPSSSGSLTVITANPTRTAVGITPGLANNEVSAFALIAGSNTSARNTLAQAGVLSATLPFGFNAAATNGPASIPGATLDIAPDRRTLYYAYSVSGGVANPAVTYLARWALARRSQLPTVRLNSGGTLASRLIDGDSRLVVVGAKRISVLDARSAGVLRSVRIAPMPPAATTAAVSPDGRGVIIGSQTGSVWFVGSATGRARRGAQAQAAGVANVVYTSDGRAAVTVGDDDTMIVWDPRTAQPSQELVGPPGQVQGAAVSPDGRTLYTSLLDGSLVEWDLAGDRRFGANARVAAAQPCCRTLSPTAPPIAVSPDASNFAVRVAPSTVGVFATGSFRREASFTVKPAGGGITALAWSPNGRELAVGGHGGLVQLWSVEGTPRLVRSLVGTRPLPGLVDAIQSLAFSPDGRVVAAGDGTTARSNRTVEISTLEIWHTGTGTMLTSANDLGAGTEPVPTANGELLAFSPRGKLVAMSQPDGSVLILNAAVAVPTQTVTPKAAATAVAFAPDETLATGSSNGIVEFWNPTTGQQTTPPRVVTSSAVTSIAFAPSGQLFATAGLRDGIVKLWFTSTQQQQAAVFSTEPRATSAVAFTSDSTHLLGVDDAGNGFTWPTSLAAWEQRACGVAGRGFTAQEWSQLIHVGTYARVCR